MKFNLVKYSNRQMLNAPLQVFLFRSNHGVHPFSVVVAVLHSCGLARYLPCITTSGGCWTCMVSRWYAVVPTSSFCLLYIPIHVFPTGLRRLHRSC
ncbi:hypothetical protein J3A83DRAFT_1001342 [Scleroderma citrinum]